MIHIILADDHPILRQGLRSVIANEPGFQLVGEASSGIEALKLVEKHQPNVVVTDLMMPDLNGLEVTRQIRERHPRIAVVILSMQADEAYIIQALQSGARGYVLKDAPSSCLIEGIREAYAGRRYLSPPLSNRALEIFAKQSQAESNDLLESLTTREREVLQLTAEGKTSAEVARLLHISPRTVETHRANLMAKLRLNNQSEVIRYALRHGLLPLDG
jgi:two-component system, NarL family, response regulator NreC